MFPFSFSSIDFGILTFSNEAINYYYKLSELLTFAIYKEKKQTMFKKRYNSKFTALYHYYLITIPPQCYLSFLFQVTFTTSKSTLHSMGQNRIFLS